MRLLLDTCTFIWLTGQPSSISNSAKQALDDEDNDLHLSMTSVLEITLKWTAGKLTLPAPPRVWIPQQVAEWSIQKEQLDEASIYRSGDLPLHHKDPFDRLLVGQAIEHNFTIVTPDEFIMQYAALTLW